MSQSWKMGDLVTVADMKEMEFDLQGVIVTTAPELIVTFYRKPPSQPPKLAATKPEKATKKSVKKQVKRKSAAKRATKPTRAVQRGRLSLTSEQFQPGDLVRLKKNKAKMGSVETGGDPVEVRFDPGRDADLKFVPAQDLELLP